MTVAIYGRVLIGQWPEAAMVMALYAIVELIEARSVDRARNAKKSLMSLAPERAEVRQEDSGSCPPVGVRCAQRDRTDQTRFKIPLDGVIVTGSSAINQASVTGESIPCRNGQVTPSSREPSVKPRLWRLRSPRPRR